MMNVVRKLGTIVEPFDQEDGLDLSEPQAKTYGLRTQLTSPGMGKKVASRNAKQHGEKFLICNRKNDLKPRPVVVVGSAQPL
jgi:hypothetical protein